MACELQVAMGGSSFSVSVRPDLETEVFCWRSLRLHMFLPLVAGSSKAGLCGGKRNKYDSRVPSRVYRAPPHPSIIPVLSCPGGHWDLIMGVPPFERCFAVVTSGHFVVKLGYFGTTFEYGHINPEFEWLGEKFFFHQIANTRAEIFANFGLSEWSPWWSSWDDQRPFKTKKCKFLQKCRYNRWYFDIWSQKQ